MNAHFSHISCRIASESWESNLAPDARRLRRHRRRRNYGNARRFRAILFAEREKMQIVEVEDAALAVERRRDDALTAEHRSGAKARSEQIHVLHAVEERQDRGIGADRRRKGIHRTLQIVGLAAQQDQIERRTYIFRKHSRRRRYVDVTFRAPHNHAKCSARRGRTRKVTSRPASFSLPPK
jgi:hypothetical protein